MKDAVIIARIRGMVSKKFTSVEIADELKIKPSDVLNICKANNIDIEHGNSLKRKRLTDEHLEKLKKQVESDPFNLPKNKVNKH